MSLDVNYETMKYFVFIVLFLNAQNLYAQDICSIVSNSSIIAQDSENTFLGKITNKYHSDSIFNEYGTYGSRYSISSIWNQYGTYGSRYALYSAFSSTTASPPIIVKNGRILGYLTANENFESSITPNLLKALCEDKL